MKAIFYLLILRLDLIIFLIKLNKLTNILLICSDKKSNGSFFYVHWFS
jgi:hypothetical protein